MERILSILSNIRPDVDFQKEEHLIDNGVLEAVNNTSFSK